MIIGDLYVNSQIEHALLFNFHKFQFNPNDRLDLLDLDKTLCSSKTSAALTERAVGEAGDAPRRESGDAKP